MPSKIENNPFQFFIQMFPDQTYIEKLISESLKSISKQMLPGGLFCAGTLIPALFTPWRTSI